MRTGFWSGNPMDRDGLKDLDSDCRITLKCIFKESIWEEVYWIYVGQDRDSWRAVVNKVMNKVAFNYHQHC